MFNLLLKFQARVVVVALATMCLVFVVIGGLNSAERNNQERQFERAGQEARFWRLVAGDVSSAQPTVDVLLARDFQTAIEDDATDIFRAPAQRYGGVFDAVGFDPFDGSALSDHTREGLGAVAADDVESFIRYEVAVASPVEGVRVTFGGSILWYMLTVITVAGTLSFLIGKPDVPVGLEWDSPGLTGWVSIVLAWPIGFGLWFYNRNRVKQREARLRELFPEQMGLVDWTGRIISRWPDDPDVQAISELRAEVLAEVKRQARYGDTADDMELRQLTTGLRDSMETLKARRVFIAGTSDG